MDGDICAQFGTKMQHDHAKYEARPRHAPKTEPEINERWKQTWVVLSDYTTHLKQIWCTAQETDNRDGGKCQTHFHENSRWRRRSAVILNFEQCQYFGADYAQRMQDGFQPTCSPERY